MINPTTYKIFKSGSTTFFTASLFFPRQAKEDVFKLYAFVRKFDDFVDVIPQQLDQYHSWKDQYQQVVAGNTVDNQIITDMVQLVQRKDFDLKWIDAFFASMEMDTQSIQYQTLDQTLEYIYGSAEVIGLMMARILDLEDEALPYAAKLGRAFQYMNMLRDIKEDLQLGRSYLPAAHYQQHGLSDVTQATAEQHPEQFSAFVRQEIDRYRQWRDEAKQGFALIPKRYRTPIAAATDMFDYTIDLIEKDPLVIYHSKIKPSKFRVAAAALRHVL